MRGAMEVTTYKIIKQIHKIALEDCRIKLLEIPGNVEISKKQVHISKFSAKRVLRLLTFEQKYKSKTVTCEKLSLYELNPMDFCVELKRTKRSKVCISHI